MPGRGSVFHVQEPPVAATSGRKVLIISMRSLELIIPPPVVALITGILMWCVARCLPWGQGVTSVSSYLSWGLMALCIGLSAAFALPALRLFKKLGTTTDPRRVHKARRLAAAGVYRYSRNPMYLGVFFLLFAWGIYLDNSLALLAAFIFPLYITVFQIRPEERYLEDKFGEEYRQYRQKVRRWL